MTADGMVPATTLLKHYLKVLRRRWLLLALLFLGVVLAAILAVRVWNPPYNARAVMQVPTTLTGSLTDVRLDVGYTERLLNTYVALSESGRLDGRVAARLPNLDTTNLKVSLSIPANTELLIVEASGMTPQVTAAGANAAAEFLIEEIRDDVNARSTAASDSLAEQIEALDGRIANAGAADEPAAVALQDELLRQRAELQLNLNQVRALSVAASSGIAIVETATAPASRPSVISLIGLAAVIGLGCAVLLVIVVDRLDETVFDVGDITMQHGYAVLGEVVARDRGRRSANTPPVTAGLRAIDPQAISLAYRLKSASPRTLMATSVHSDAATVSYVAELCLALASTGLKLAVVDTAIAAVRLATLLEVKFYDGDADSESRVSTAADVTRPTLSDNLHVASGRWAAEFIGMSDYPRKALDRLESDFDLVVVFVPALLERAEASLLGRAVEGTLLLVREGEVSEDDLRRSFRQIESLPSRFFGVVVGKHDSRRHGH